MHGKRGTVAVAATNKVYSSVLHDKRRATIAAEMLEHRNAYRFVQIKFRLDCVILNSFSCRIQACRNIFQSPTTATKEQRHSIEHVCNDNNTNSKVLNCVKQVIDLTPIDNSRQCKSFQL